MSISCFRISTRCLDFKEAEYESGSDDGIYNRGSDPGIILKIQEYGVQYIYQCGGVHCVVVCLRVEDACHAFRNPDVDGQDPDGQHVSGDPGQADRDCLYL